MSKLMNVLWQHCLVMRESDQGICFLWPSSKKSFSDFLFFPSSGFSIELGTSGLNDHIWRTNLTVAIATKVFKTFEIVPRYTLKDAIYYLSIVKLTIEARNLLTFFPVFEFHSVLAEDNICYNLPSKHLKYINYWLRLRNQYGLHCCSFFPTQVRWWHQIHATMGPKYFFRSH